MTIGNLKLRSCEKLKDQTKFIIYGTMLSCQNIFNYSDQMHNIYSLHIFTVFLLHVLVLLTSSRGRTLCPLSQTTCWYAAIIYGYYKSYSVNVKGVLSVVMYVWET
jgi:hypothetical protein